MRRNLCSGISLSALPVLCSIALAGDSGGSASDPKSQLESADIGQVWFGPKFDTDTLKGHVVLFDFWGLK
jgi:hypothetical protein